MSDYMHQRRVMQRHFNSALNVPFKAAAVIARILVPQRQNTLRVQQPGKTIGQLNFAVRAFGTLTDAVKKAPASKCSGPPSPR